MVRLNDKAFYKVRDYDWTFNIGGGSRCTLISPDSSTPFIEETERLFRVNEGVTVQIRHDRLGIMKLTDARIISIDVGGMGTFVEFFSAAPVLINGEPCAYSGILSLAWPTAKKIAELMEV